MTKKCPHRKLVLWLLDPDRPGQKSVSEELITVNFSVLADLAKVLKVWSPGHKKTYFNADLINERMIITIMRFFCDAAREAFHYSFHSTRCASFERKRKFPIPSSKESNFTEDMIKISSNILGHKRVAAGSLRSVGCKRKTSVFFSY